jgi:hypothetical protein
MLIGYLVVVFVGLAATSYMVLSNIKDRTTDFILWACPVISGAGTLLFAAVFPWTL